MSHDNDQTSDSALFRAAVGNVRPVKQDRLPPSTPRPGATPLQQRKDDLAVLEDMLSDEYISAELQPGDILGHSSPGLQRNILRKLRRGDYRREAELDLHGMTADMARKALAVFLTDARHRRWRCIRIIHGKGLRSTNHGPVLKSRLNTWLLQRKDVLAFCSAPPADGGTGAVYVLLRSR